jgi:hypothetical protein
LKTLWKEATIANAIKDIHDSWEKVKMSIWTGVWKKLVATFVDDFEGSRLQGRK